MESIEVCHAHSGIVSNIDNLKRENDEQWKSLKKTEDKVDGIMVRLNIILGGIVVSVIALLFDIATRISLR